jgi:peptide/nickel transport system substrate-binding protein
MSRTFKILSGAHAASVLVVACGGASSQGSGTSTRKAEPNATLRFGETNAAADTLDPQRSNQSYGADWYGPAYEALLFANRNRVLQPQLATKWSFSADGMTLTLTLRSGVTFSDGTPFNATAVKANIERGQTLTGSQVKTLLAPIASVVAVNDTTAQLNLKAPNAAILTDLGGKAGYMISPAAFNRSDLNVKPVGTGPFVLDQYNPGVSATYIRNPHYWGTPAGVAKIQITTFTDTTAAVNALASGQIDLAHLFDNQAATVVRNAKQQVLSDPGLGVEWIGLNFGGKFSDLRVRQALAYASDRKTLTDFAGTGSPAYQWVTRDSPLYDKSLGDVYSYDPKKAKDLLTQAGYPNGFSFTLIHTDRPYTNQSAQVMQAQWAKAGFNVTIQTTDGATILSKCYVQHVCDAISGIYTESPELTRDVADITSANGRRNMGGATALPGIADYLTPALVPSNDRTQVLQKLQSQFVKDIPMVCLRYDVSLYGARTTVFNADVDPNASPLWGGIKMAAS